MTRIEWYLLAVSLAGLVLFARGCSKRSLSSCVLGLVVGLLSCVGYFVAFSLTRTPFFGVVLLLPYLVVLPVFWGWFNSNPGRALTGCVIVLCAAVAGIEFKLVSMGNAMLIIEPYRSGAVWRFDEPRLHLKGEPFVLGMPEMIDKMAAGVPGSKKAIRLTFSQQEFPGWQQRLDLLREDKGGNWYHNAQYNLDGWLCPALFKFFPRAPQHIYARADAVE